MKTIYNKFGWPVKNFKAKKPRIYYLNKIFYCPSFLWRKVFLSVDCKNYKLIPNWYLDEHLSNSTRKNLLFFKFFYLTNFFFNIFIKCNFFFIKKTKLQIDDDEVIILGPYINNHTHKITEFLLRLFILKQFKNIKKVYVPDELKVLIFSLKIDIYLGNIEINYYKSHENYLFYNAHYLSHVEIRKYNPTYKKSILVLKKILNSQKFLRNSKYKYILISRENNKRKLINEAGLFEALEPLGFVKINFEKLNIKNQINISRNAKIIIGYHGAGLINCFFMKKNSNFIEIVNAHYNHPFFKLTCKMLKLNYKNFLCSENFQNLDGICNTNEIVQYIKRII